MIKLIKDKLQRKLKEGYSMKNIQRKDINLETKFLKEGNKS